MPDKVLDKIFRSGSTTYYFSSMFFPQKAREDVFKLYAFVRTADDLVDSVPQDKEGFYSFKKEYEEAASNQKSSNSVIGGFVRLSREKGFESAWAAAFLSSMEKDLVKTSYRDIKELEEYIYGSAEVIGLMMARIMKLPKEADNCARQLGKAMQLINFIRDIKEDLALGRTYLPQDEIRSFGLSAKDFCSASASKDAFRDLIALQIERYRSWMEEAAAGFRFLPKKYLVPVKTASDMYDWTAQQIKKAPLVVFSKKVKPSRTKILLYALKNIIAYGGKKK